MIGDPLAPRRHRWSYLDDIKFKVAYRRQIAWAVLISAVAAGIFTVATNPTGTDGPTRDQYEQQRP